MALSPTRPQYICKSCIATIQRWSASHTVPAPTAQRRYSSNGKANQGSFTISKHYKKLSRSDEAVGKHHGSLRTSEQPTWKSGLKVNLNDGQHVARSGKRIPFSAPRNSPPLRKVERSRDTANIKKPSFILGRQQSKTKVDAASSPPVKIWSPEKPMSHVSLHFSTLQDWNWYWETLPPTVAQKTQAQHFFTKKASPRFLQSVAFFRAFPESDVPEIAFVGRSNVGKSSLLNAIVNADTKALLARTSSTPGFTKTMNLYGLGPQGGVHYKKQPSGHGKIVGASGITIVDMPGYGEGSLIEWGTEIMKYLQGRKQLRRVFVLIDAQHGVKDKDRSLLASLRLGGIPHQVILSKIDKVYLPEAKAIKRFDGKRLDKLKPTGTVGQLRQTMEKLREEIQPSSGAGAIGEILACSSEVLVDERRLGIDAVRFAMLQAIGFPFRNDQRAVEQATHEGPVIRAMKTNPKEEKEEIVVRKVAPASSAGVQPTAKEIRAARRAGRRPRTRTGPSPVEMLESLSGNSG